MCVHIANDTETQEFYGHETSRGKDHLSCLYHYTNYQRLAPDICPDCRIGPLNIWRVQRVINVTADPQGRGTEYDTNVISVMGERGVGIPQIRLDSGGKKRKSTNRRYKHARVTRRGRYNRVRVTRRNHQSKKQK
jgi:hypothetical protein